MPLCLRRYREKRNTTIGAIYLWSKRKELVAQSQKEQITLITYTCGFQSVRHSIHSAFLSTLCYTSPSPTFLYKVIPPFCLKSSSTDTQVSRNPQTSLAHPHSCADHRLSDHGRGGRGRGGPRRGRRTPSCRRNHIQGSAR